MRLYHEQVDGYTEGKQQKGSKPSSDEFKGPSMAVGKASWHSQETVTAEESRQQPFPRNQMPQNHSFSCPAPLDPPRDTSGKGSHPFREEETSSCVGSNHGARRASVTSYDKPGSKPDKGVCGQGKAKSKMDRPNYHG